MTRRRSRRSVERRLDALEAQSGGTGVEARIVYAPNAFYDDEGVMQVPEDEHPRYVDSDGHGIDEHAVREAIMLLPGSPTDDGSLSTFDAEDA
jgi:hypothetical protein